MTTNNNQIFDEVHVLHELKHYLPTQTPLKDFIHHNSLHAFQQMKFYDGTFKAAKIFGFQATLQLDNFRELHRIGRINDEVLSQVICIRKGKENLSAWREKALKTPYDEHNEARLGKLRANWKTHYKMDMDTLVHPLLFRILACYLDQGIAVWEFPTDCKGLLEGIVAIEKNSFTSFFKTKRAKSILLSENFKLECLLKTVVGKEEYFDQYLFDQQFEHKGWSGMVAAIENDPSVVLNPKKISLRDLIALELLMEIDALDYKFGEKWQPLCNYVTEKPADLFAEIEGSELQEVFKIWQDAFEWSYYDTALAGIKYLKENPISTVEKPSFQAMFCIDERECSIRRHVESVDTNCVTLGMPGFFGVEFYFESQNAKFYDKVCPAPVTPTFLVKEFGSENKREHDSLYTNRSHTLFGGYISSFVLGFWAIIRLIQNIFAPKMAPAISNAFGHVNKDSKLLIENVDGTMENGLQVGFTMTEMATRVEGLLRGSGLIDNFAPLVYLVAHGSSSANNPHHGAHDCGACSGRPGSVNARVMSFMANHTQVRAILSTKGINIPNETQFIGSLHDTASDQIEFYDEGVLNTENIVNHTKNKQTFEDALDLNAKERSRRFASIDTKGELKKVREDIRKRSVSLFVPRDRKSVV